MAAQASTLYATNIRHMLTDLTPKKDGVIIHNMEDDVIRGATVTHAGAITFPPPPPKIAAIAAAKPKEKAQGTDLAEKRAQEVARSRRRPAVRSGCWLSVPGAAGLVGPMRPARDSWRTSSSLRWRVSSASQVIWNVSHSPAHAADGRHQRHFGHHRSWVRCCRSGRAIGWSWCWPPSRC